MAGHSPSYRMKHQTLTTFSKNRYKFWNNVVVTDLPQFMPLLDKNIDENRDRLKGEARVRTLEWGTPLDADFAFPDVVLISECVYYDKAVEPLLKTMVAVCGPSTEVLLSYEDRESEANAMALRRFLEGCREHFLVEEVPQHHQHPDFSSHDIHILKMKPIER